MLRRFAWLALAVAALGAAVLALSDPPDHSAGEIRGPRRTAQEVAAGARRVAAAAARLRAPDKQILFGDLHVHSTFSIDAFLYALPLFGGEGSHPPADACDFARHCAALDFFSMNDHAESLTPERWRESIDSIRQCNERAGNAADPDLVAFVGYEWTQTGSTPESHYGHRNVIFEGLGDGDLPVRPITALPDGITERARAMWLVRGLERLGPLGLGDYADFLWLTRQIAETPDCPRDARPGAPPEDCRENAATPAELHRKLAASGLSHLVIPHGLAWGIHAPPGARLDLGLAAGQHDPHSERLLEIFSGHGNSEEFRDFPEFESDRNGERVCPEPRPDYLPCCWRAGELMRARCGGLAPEECERRVVEARQLALDAGSSPHRIFPDTRPEDWLDCDQCRDCFKPAMTLRPGDSAQYSLAVASFDPADPDAPPRRYRWGFIASTDNHSARPGTGYKQQRRRSLTDARGYAGPTAERLVRSVALGRQQDPQRAQASPPARLGFQNLLDVERQASFMYPGGIVAVHSEGRDRRAIFRALERREVYATSGPRILLWFDLENGPDGPVPMGGSVTLAANPRFSVRAAGATVQRDGCPEPAARALGPERLERLCRGACFHPGDGRHPLEAIEVVRVRPQVRAGEDVAPLIEDPWRRIPCGVPECVAEFDDPDYLASGRPAVYYARAIQAPTPAINGANLRGEFDAQGELVATRPCHGGYRTGADDDCLAPAGERAWSSPIFVDPPPAGAARKPD